MANYADAGAYFVVTNAMITNNTVTYREWNINGFLPTPFAGIGGSAARWSTVDIRQYRRQPRYGTRDSAGPFFVTTRSTAAPFGDGNESGRVTGAAVARRGFLSLPNTTSDRRGAAGGTCPTR